MSRETELAPMWREMTCMTMELPNYDDS